MAFMQCRPFLFTVLCLFFTVVPVYAQPQPGDYSATQYEVVEELDRAAPMRDGAKLMLDVFRPKDDGRFPAILQHTPYGSRAWPRGRSGLRRAAMSS
jgi:uncharacterized protein